MDSSPAPPPAPPPPAEDRQRRYARAMGFTLVFTTCAWTVAWLAGIGTNSSLGDLLTINGLMLGPGLALLHYARTGEDPKGYAQPLFRSKASPALPPESPQDPK